MAKTMKAAVVRNFGKPLAIEDVPVPGAGIRRTACQGDRLRRVSHGSALGRGRLASEAGAAFHPWP